MLMKLIRDLKWKLADRFPSLDRKSLYYNPPKSRGFETAPKDPLSPWDKVLLAMVAMILTTVGAMAVALGLWVLYLLITG